MVRQEDLIVNLIASFNIVVLFLLILTSSVNNLIIFTICFTFYTNVDLDVYCTYDKFAENFLP